jgi:predicted AAA+ superfamily ATPase
MINDIGVVMHHIPRILHLPDIANKKSVFLFGARQTGKSTLIRHQFDNPLIYNLLDASLYRKLNSDPSLIRKEISAMAKTPKIVVIDEIQMIPELLNEVHLLIEEYQINFVLTGSSARALKKKGVNLLAGRARSRTLHPFIYKELKNEFDLLKALNQGLIPSIYFSDEYQEDLANYSGVYLKEEIAAEGLSRNIPAFSRFLEVAAKSNGCLINFTNIASDAEVKRGTVVDYFQILRDTLIGFDLPAWTKSTNRKPITTSKFYFFDIGIVNHLCKNGEIKEGSSLYGAAFEHYIFHELKTYCDYSPEKELHFWRSKSGFEVDFILNNDIAIEVKAKKTVSNKDLKGLKALRDENLVSRYIVLSNVDTKRIEDGIEIYPYREFLDELWN